MSAEYRRRLAALLGLALVVLAAGVGLRDPWPADEPRFALIAIDMASGGDWLFPRVGGDLYPDKPPLFFWLIAVFYLLTGSVRVAFLLPGVVAGMGVLLLVTDLARRLYDERTALFCGATLLALLQFPLQMKSGQIDALLCLWTTLSLYGLCRHLLLGPDWRWYTIGGVAAGLGVITKGVGVLPYLVLIPYAFALWRGWPVTHGGRRDWRWALAPAASLTIVGLWLLPMLLAVSLSGDPGLEGYRDNILFHQTVTRYANSWGHIKPPWYLLTNAVPWLWLPVTPLLPFLLPAWRADLRARDSRVLLLGGWILLVLLFFSLSKGKRSLYIFPAAPALALIAGAHASDLVRRVGVQRVLLALSALLSAVLVAAGVALLLRPALLARQLADPEVVHALAVGLLVTGAVAVLATGYCGRARAAAGYLAVMTSLWLGIGLLMAPAIDRVRSGAELIDAVRAALPPDRTLAFVDWPEQFLLQWRQSAVHFGHRRDNDAELADASTWLAAHPDGMVLLPGHLVDPCFAAGRLTEIGFAHRRHWFLGGADALTGACASPGGVPAEIFHYLAAR